MAYVWPGMCSASLAQATPALLVQRLPSAAAGAGLSPCHLLQASPSRFRSWRGQACTTPPQALHRMPSPPDRQRQAPRALSCARPVPSSLFPPLTPNITRPPAPQAGACRGPAHVPAGLTGCLSRRPFQERPLPLPPDQQAASGVVFPSVRHPHRAVQAVHVTAAPPLYPPPLPPWGGPAVPEGLRGSTVRGRGGPAGGPGGGDDANGWDQELKGVLDASGQGGVELVGGLPAGGAWSGAGQRQGGGSSSSSSSNGGEGGSQRPRVHTFTWCLERVETGALKGVWYTVGVRVGDYSF